MNILEQAAYLVGETPILLEASYDKSPKDAEKEIVRNFDKWFDYAVRRDHDTPESRQAYAHEVVEQIKTEFIHPLNYTAANYYEEDPDAEVNPETGRRPLRKIRKVGSTEEVDLARFKSTEQFVKGLTRILFTELHYKTARADTSRINQMKRMLKSAYYKYLEVVQDGGARTEGDNAWLNTDFGGLSFKELKAKLTGLYNDSDTKWNADRAHWDANYAGRAVRFSGQAAPTAEQEAAARAAEDEEARAAGEEPEVPVPECCNRDRIDLGNGYHANLIHDYAQSHEWTDFTGRRSKWCLTYGSSYWNGYVSRYAHPNIYFLWKEGFQNLNWATYQREDQRPAGHPYDPWGLSLMCVMVAPNAATGEWEIKQITSRYNHDGNAPGYGDGFCGGTGNVGQKLSEVTGIPLNVLKNKLPAPTVRPNPVIDALLGFKQDKLAFDRRSRTKTTFHGEVRIDDDIFTFYSSNYHRGVTVVKNNNEVFVFPEQYCSVHMSSNGHDSFYNNLPYIIECRNNMYNIFDLRTGKHLLDSWYPTILAYNNYQPRNTLFYVRGTKCEPLPDGRWPDHSDIKSNIFNAASGQFVSKEWDKSLRSLSDVVSSSGINQCVGDTNKTLIMPVTVKEPGRQNVAVYAYPKKGELKKIPVSVVTYGDPNMLNYKYVPAFALHSASGKYVLFRHFGTATTLKYDNRFTHYVLYDTSLEKAVAMFPAGTYPHRIITATGVTNRVYHVNGINIIAYDPARFDTERPLEVRDAEVGRYRDPRGNKLTTGYDDVPKVAFKKKPDGTNLVFVYDSYGIMHVFDSDLNEIVKSQGVLWCGTVDDIPGNNIVALKNDYVVVQSNANAKILVISLEDGSIKRKYNTVSRTTPGGFINKGYPIIPVETEDHRWVAYNTDTDEELSLPNGGAISDVTLIHDPEDDSVHYWLHSGHSTSADNIMLEDGTTPLVNTFRGKRLKFNVLGNGLAVGKNPREYFFANYKGERLFEGLKITKLVTMWSEGIATVEAVPANAGADAEPTRYYINVLGDYSTAIEELYESMYAKNDKPMIVEKKRPSVLDLASYLM